MSDAAAPSLRRRGLSRKGRRLALIAAALAVLGLATGLALLALRDTVSFYRTPSQLAGIAPGQRLRLGGLVEAGSVAREGDGTVRFTVTDGGASTPVVFRGILPDLFREGQGVVAEGRMDGAGFRADHVLARHDETYMPREVARSLQEQGLWRDGEPPPGSKAAR